MYDLSADGWRPHEGRRATLHDYEPGADDFLMAALEGLAGEPKSLPCRFLYDARGSALFDRICRLPEYYPTRTEIGILEDNATEIADRLGPNVQLVELGSGSSVKVRVLLHALDTPETYVPIDISREHLMQAAQAIQDDYPELRVEAICADFSQDFRLPPVGRGRRVGFYPGSTIGNLTPDEAREFLSLWSRRLGQGALFLVGVDLRKAADILEPAYDDAQGVTSAFSLNLLRRANRELGADFDLGRFRHEARYLDEEGRVAIHLVSQADQTVRLGGAVFALKAGERIHIEDSWKYSLDGFRRLARKGGFAPLEVWTDAERLFSVHLLEAVG
ncbi:L-histidine N(alpha)-methyltransferase [Brevundimonas sp.]|uniref:L-histidine N(alpha)-methyltransferase n=1 Tax=Brevundimonas sp. TaxID=1871086 RepID=UPI0025E3605D|nr:L-histidine N(alpha)-methyltransferase [Brevundimonas sp.]